LIALTIAGCATAPPNPQLRERARQHLLAGKSCADKHIVYEDPQDPIFVLSGCGLMAAIKVTCDGSACLSSLLEGHDLMQPRRLQTSDGKLWLAPNLAAPAPPGPPAPSDGPVTIKSGKRLTELGQPAVTPSLPTPLNRGGVTVWGMYRVCVSAAGEVTSVRVDRSALPGGLDAEWIAKMERWRYQPYEVNGRPVPFCSPVRLQVQGKA
jgi:hypothetical protein